MKEALRDPELQTLLDIQSLKDIAFRYARAIDRRDRDLLLSLYHEDAIDDHGTVFKGSARQFADFQPAVMEPFAVTAHYMINTAYVIAGDMADGELYFVAYHRLNPPKKTEVIVGGRYLDRYERREGRWKISHRTIVWDFARESTPTQAELDFLASLGPTGSGSADLSMHVLPLFARIAGRQ